MSLLLPYSAGNGPLNWCVFEIYTTMGTIGHVKWSVKHRPTKSQLQNNTPTETWLTNVRSHLTQAKIIIGLVWCLQFWLLTSHMVILCGPAWPSAQSHDGTLGHAGPHQWLKQGITNYSRLALYSQLIRYNSLTQDYVWEIFIKIPQHAVNMPTHWLF